MKSNNMTKYLLIAASLVLIMGKSCSSPDKEKSTETTPEKITAMESTGGSLKLLNSNTPLRS